MFIPALDTEEGRREIEAEDLVLLALRDNDDPRTMRYSLLGHCSGCGGTDLVQFLIDEQDGMTGPWCAENTLRGADPAGYPILFDLLRRLGVNVDLFARKTG